jgi:hypothetical protein
MDTHCELQDARDEVLKRIGRNLLLFQQAEHLIKRLVATDSLSIRHCDSLRSFEDRATSFQKMTMGQVAKLFLDRICPAIPPSETNSAAPCSTNEVYSLAVQVRLDIGLDTEVRKNSFDRLIEQRNELVHHQFQRHHPESLENYRRIADELDAQRREILPEILRLQQDLESTREMLEVITAFLNTPGGMVELLRPEIQQSPLIKNLAEIAGKSPDAEGWTALGEATGQLQDFPAEAIREHYTQFGQKSLSALLQASGLFDTTQKGNTETCHGRTFYRLRRHAGQAPSQANHP